MEAAKQPHGALLGRCVPPPPLNPAEERWTESSYPSHNPATPAAEAASGLAEGEGVGQEEEEEEGKGAMQRLKRWWKKTAKIDRKKMAELGAYVEVACVV